MELEIQIDDLGLLVEVTHFVDVPANPSSWDSDLDFYGYCEVEFEVVSGFDEETDAELTTEQLASVAKNHHDTITQKIVERFEDMRDAA